LAGTRGRLRRQVETPAGEDRRLHRFPERHARTRITAPAIILPLLAPRVLAHNRSSLVPDRMPDQTPVTASATQPLLQAVEISKRFGDLVANDAINLDLMPHEIHALLGENGAGKSTLVKIMYGLIQPSAGELRWQGEKIALASPAQALARGINLVFQHFSLFENLTVAENVALGLPSAAPLATIAARVA